MAKHNGSVKYARIYNMGVDRVEQVKYMLATGVSPNKVAHHIQNEWGEIADVLQDSLHKQLQRFRKEIVDPGLKTKVVVPLDELEGAEDLGDGRVRHRGLTLPTVPGATLDGESYTGVILVNKVPKSRDVVGELNELIELQKARVKKLYDREFASPLLLATLRNEIRQLGELLKMMGALQLETGVLTRVPKKQQLLLPTADDLQQRAAHKEEIVVSDALAEASVEILALLDSFEEVSDVPS